MKKIKIGVMGAYRGSSMINYCDISENAEIVAICDKWKEAIEIQKKSLGDDSITYYEDFEDFINHDMDAVVLANYANEHAPFAIRCLNKGLHVYSEVLPCQTMKEAVELIEAVEKSGKVWAYGENYCYMGAPREMKKLYEEGKIGELEYAEGEYIHNCEPVWHDITYGDENHWRNNMYATFYCTHSIGPLIHATGLRPVSVIGIEGTKIERNLRVGKKSGQFGIELITLENGGIIKSVHGNLYKNSIWYTMYGSKGRMESSREDVQDGGTEKIYINADEYVGEYGDEHLEAYTPEMSELAKKFGHGGSDYYSMDNFVKKIKGEADADIIDVYEALDMFLPGLLAYRSILNGNISIKIPNLRNREERDAFRNDTACTDKKVAGDQYITPFSKGELDIPKAIYDTMRAKFEKDASDTNNGYINLVTSQGKVKE